MDLKNWLELRPEPWRRGAVSLTAAIAGGVVVAAQGLVVGLFGHGHDTFQWGTFLLDAWLGSLPAGVFFAVADLRRWPDSFVIDAAAAMVATGLILIFTQISGGLRASDVTLLTFAVTTYATLGVVARIATRPAFQRVMRIFDRGDPGAPRQPETGESEQEPKRKKPRVGAKSQTLGKRAKPSERSHNQ